MGKTLKRKMKNKKHKKPLKVYSKKDFALTGFRKKIRYQLGQKVKVKVKKADLEKKQLDFILV